MMKCCILMEAIEGPNWPAGGEIDISEGINLRTNNMVALHTTGGT